MIGNTNSQQGTGKRRHSVRESGCSEQRRRGNRPSCAAILQVRMKMVCGGPQKLQGAVSPDNLKEQAALPALALPEALPLGQWVCFITETLRISRTCPLVFPPLTPATVRHVPSLKAELPMAPSVSLQPARRRPEWMLPTAHSVPLFLLHPSGVTSLSVTISSFKLGPCPYRETPLPLSDGREPTRYYEEYDLLSSPMTRRTKMIPPFPTCTRVS